MKRKDVEAALGEPTNFMQRWPARWCNLPTMKIVYVSLLVLVIVAHFVTYVSWPSNDSKENVNNPDSELENLGVYYRKSLNQNSQPCEDFYAFACRNLRNKYRKENKDYFDTMAMMEKRVRVSLDDLLTKPFNTSDSATLRQMKIFQQMCINKTKIETEGIEPVLAVLNEMGGWPLLTNDSESNESWEHIVGNVNRAGFFTVFPYFLDSVADLNITMMVLEPFLGYPRRRVLPRTNRTLEYVKLIASLLNARNSRLDDDIENCISFESELYKLAYSVVQDEEVHTLESLTTEYPAIAWKTFFGNAFVSTGIEISSNLTVFFSYSEYNVKVAELLNKTSARIVRNYVVWSLIVDAVALMPERFREAKNAFEQRTVGQSRNLDCMDTLINKAKVSIGYLYIKNFFDVLAKNKSHGMIKSIESEAYRFLKIISWMDNATKTKIIDTLRNSEIFVPDPDDSIDVMETLEFQTNDTIFANYRRLAEGHRNFEYIRLRISEEVERKLIPIQFAVKADAWNFASMNASFMLAAIFQRPFFSAIQPMYLNYGGIGFTMAHELTHGLKILSACDNEECPSFDHFQERKECLEKLYGGYVLKQLNKTVDGKQTVRENIGDLIGLKLSYRAYEEFAKGAEEPLVPGLNYTARQWFWINAATTLCSYHNDAALRKHLSTEEHSPPEARVNVAFANTDEFSRDFECPIGSRMNPVRKCGFEESVPSFHPPARKCAFEILWPFFHQHGPRKDEL